MVGVGRVHQHCNFSLRQRIVSANIERFTRGKSGCASASLLPTTTPHTTTISSPTCPPASSLAVVVFVVFVVVVVVIVVVVVAGMTLIKWAPKPRISRFDSAWQNSTTMGDILSALCHHTFVARRRLVRPKPRRFVCKRIVIIHITTVWKRKGGKGDTGFSFCVYSQQQLPLRCTLTSRDPWRSAILGASRRVPFRT
jgi:hypothetical protein